MNRWAAILPAGGSATRLGGIDKVALEVGGQSLLSRAVNACVGAEPIVVVGPRRPVPSPVVWTVEAVPGSGPVAAIAAGLSLVDAGVDCPVVLLAADMPRVTPHTIARLLTSVGETGAILVDHDGRDQWLAGVWRLGVLRAAVPSRPEGLSLRRVLGGLAPTRVRAVADEVSDVDTPDDLSRVTG
ncbi:MAG: NTP transferase domain-containing protein [Actinomycetota bacterium]|nr:NTP transferase domain-containing protein [Actinomycetota bacterium]